MGWKFKYSVALIIFEANHLSSVVGEDTQISFIRKWFASGFIKNNILKRGEKSLIPSFNINCMICLREMVHCGLPTQRLFSRKVLP